MFRLFNLTAMFLLVLTYSSTLLANQVFCAAIVRPNDGPHTALSLITNIFNANDNPGGFYSDTSHLGNKWKGYLKTSMPEVHATEAGCMNGSEYAAFSERLKNNGDPVKLVNWPSSKGINQNSSPKSNAGQNSETTDVTSDSTKRKDGKKWEHAIQAQCLTSSTVDGKETFFNKCTFPVIVSYCILNPDANHQYFKCSPEQSASSPTGINLSKASLQVQPGESNSVGGLPAIAHQTYAYLGCKIDQIPVLYNSDSNGQPHSTACFITR